MGGVAFDGQHLYWIDVGDDFATPPRPLAAHRAPWTGKSIGAAERLSSGCTGLPTSYSGTAIQVDESHAYFLANELFRVPRGGGTCERVGGKFVYSFAIRGDALFTDEGGEILRYRKAQPTAAAPVTKVDTVKGLAAGDDFLAFFDPLRGLVHSVPPAGAAAPTVMAARQFGTSTLLVSGREILWFDGNQALHAVPAGGGEPRLVARQPGAQTARAIQAAVISGQRVLFLVEGTSYQVGGLMSVPLAGGPLRMVAQLRVDANNVHRLVASGTIVLAVQSGSPARVFAFDVR